MVATYIKSFLE